MFPLRVTFHKNYVEGPFLAVVFLKLATVMIWHLANKAGLLKSSTDSDSCG